MLDRGFVAPSINITTLDPELPNLNIVQETRDEKLSAIMSNSFGFGGTNGSVVMRKI